MADKGVLKILLRDCRRRPVADPATRISFLRPGDGSVIQKHPSLGFTVNQPRKFNLPTLDEEFKMFYRINPKNFHALQSEFFSLVEGDPRTHDPVFLRDPGRSRAVFRPWSGLGQKFSTLKKILGRSLDLALYRKDKDPLPKGPLTGARYDNFDGPGALHAKAALLNVTTKLRDTPIPNTGAGSSWLDHVDQILVLRHDRFIAIVSKKMAGYLEHIDDNQGDFLDYKPTPAKNHFKFIPASIRAKYNIVKGDMFSVKTKDAKGNLQLTIAPGTDGNGKKVYLFDADIDENGRLLAHIRDVLKHKFTGGTHPFYIHQLLCYANPTVQIGYDLKAKP